METTLKTKKKVLKKGEDLRPLSALPKRFFRTLRSSPYLTRNNNNRHTLRFNKTLITSQVMKKKTIKSWFFDEEDNILENNKLWRKTLVDLKTMKRVRHVQFLTYQPPSTVQRQFSFGVEALKRQSFLQTLDVQGYGDEHILILLSQELKKLKESLLELTIVLFGKTKTLGLQNLCQGMKRHVSLQILVLDFYGSNFTDTDLKSLSKSLKRLSCLKRFEIWFGGLSITDNGAYVFFSSLKNLTSLQYLAIFFQGSHFNEAQGLVETLNQLKSSLRHLDLTFCGSDSLTDMSVEMITEAISKMQVLRTLIFSLSHCSQLTDRSLESILWFFKPLKSLKSFSFDAKENPLMTKKKKVTFIDKMSSIKGLSFDDSEVFTDLDEDEVSTDSDEDEVSSGSSI